MKKNSLRSLSKTAILLLILSCSLVCEDLVTITNADDGSTETKTYSQSQADAVKEKRNKVCEGLDIKVELKSESEMSEKRDENKNAFTETVDILMDVYKNGDYMKLVNPKLTLILMVVIFLVFVILSVIIFWINLCICCCNGDEKNKGCCISCNLVIALVGLVGFAGCCVAIAVFVTGVKNGMQEVNCSLHIIQDDIINGNKAVNDFMGFFPLTEIINSYIDDFTNLTQNHGANLDAIVNLNLHTSSKSALDSLDTFCADCASKETTDGVGTKTKPHSVTDVLDGLKTGAKEEFKIVADTCKIIHDGAVAGKEQVDNPDVNAALDSLKSVVSLISGIILTFDTSFGSIGNSYDTIDSSYNTAQIVFIVFCFLCLLIGLLIFICLCCAYNNKGCDKFGCFRFAIAIFGMFTLIFMIFSFAVGAVTFATSASCGLLQQFTKQAGIDNFVELFSLDAQMQTILTTCLLESGDGSITKIFMGEGDNQSSSDMFAQVQELLDMFTSYEEVLAELNTDRTSKAFTIYNDTLNQFKSGELPDHDNVVPSLGSLNNFVTCDASINYSLTSTSCPDGSTCIDLKTTSTYTKPSCADDGNTAAATKFVTDLNKYINETETLMNELHGKTYSLTTSPDTPNKLFKDTLTDFDTAIEKINLIKADLTDTINMLENNNLESGSNCKIIRAEFQSLESSLCFKFVPELYKFMLAAFLGSIFFFSFIWHLCCGNFCLERSGEHGSDAEIPDNYDNTNFNPKNQNNNYYN